MPGIEKELSLMKNKPCTRVEHEPGIQALPSEYVFRVKNGFVEASSVALRNLQSKDIFKTMQRLVKSVAFRATLATEISFR